MNKYEVHEQTLEKTFALVKELLQQDNWKKNGECKEFRLENYLNEESIPASKGVGIFNIKKEKIIETLTIDKHIQECFQDIYELETIVKTPKNYEIKYYAIHLEVGDDRDMLQIKGIFEEGNSTYIVLTSIIDDEIKQKVKKRVRANDNFTAYKITNINDKQTEITNLTSIDLKGYLTSQYINKKYSTIAIDVLKIINNYINLQQ